MNLALWKKNYLDARLLFVMCGLVLFGFCWLRIWIVAGLFDASHFRGMVNLFRDYIDDFVTVSPDFLISYPGRIALGFVDWVVILPVMIWSITRGSDAVSGELGRGTMEMLLAQPVSRFETLLTQTLTTILGLAGLVSLAWLGTLAGIFFNTVEQADIQAIALPLSESSDPEVIIRPMWELAPPHLFLPATANLFGLAFCVSGIATLMSSWDRYRWRTIGITAGIYIVQLVMKLVGMGIKPLSWMTYLTLFTCFDPLRATAAGETEAWRAWTLLVQQEEVWLLGPLGHTLVLISLGLAAYVAAFAIFAKRDLPAPM